MNPPVAVFLAVFRANKDDLPAIVRALFGRLGDDDRDDPPALPQPLGTETEGGTFHS
jgi:hypothetical protein